MLQLCENDKITDLLYFKKSKYFSNIVVYVNSHPNVIWTAIIPGNF
jgi:hypothetical protein